MTESRREEIIKRIREKVNNMNDDEQIDEGRRVQKHLTNSRNKFVVRKNKMKERIGKKNQLKR